MSTEITHPEDHIEVIGNAISRVLGRHLGVMLDDTEANAILDEIDKQGYTLTQYDTGQQEPTIEAAGVTVVIHANATDDHQQTKHAILNARRALTTEI